MRVFNPETGREMVRKLRRRYDGEFTPRELTFSCYHGYSLLARDRTRTWFVNAVQNARATWAVDIWAWVIMPEHVHLLVAPREKDIAIGKFQGQIKEEVARRAILWLERNAPEFLNKISIQEGSRLRRRFWQAGGGYDRNIDNLKTLGYAIDYLHLNPVRRGLVQRAIDWQWSSAPFYAGMTPVPLEMDRTLPIFYEIGTD